MFLKWISWLSPLTVLDFVLWTCLGVPVLNFFGLKLHWMMCSKSLSRLSAYKSLVHRIGLDLVCIKIPKNACTVSVRSWMLVCFIFQVSWHCWTPLANIGGAWSWVVYMHPRTCRVSSGRKGVILVGPAPGYFHPAWCKCVRWGRRLLCMLSFHSGQPFTAYCPLCSLLLSEILRKPPY